MRIEIILLMSLLSINCASPWKIHGGANECRKMCKEWDLEFTSMVGVGNQDSSGDGATACVCQPKESLKASTLPAAASSAASLAAPVSAAQAAAAAAAGMQMKGVSIPK